MLSNLGLGFTQRPHLSASASVFELFVGCAIEYSICLYLQVNGIDLEGRSNEQALGVLRTELARGGVVSILVAKYWDMENQQAARRAPPPPVISEPLYEPIGSSVGGSTLRPGPLKTVPPEFLIQGGSRAGSMRGAPPQSAGPGGSRPRLYREASGTSNSDSGSSGPRGASRQPVPGEDEPFVGAELIAWIRSQDAGLKNLPEALAYADRLLQAGRIYTVNRAGANPDRARNFRFKEDEYYVFGKAWDGPQMGNGAPGAGGAYL